MGYYTNYVLSVEEYNPAKIDAIEKIVIDEWGMSRWCEGQWYQSEIKWYDHDDDMLKLSLQFPDNVFDLYGEGEEATDMWHTYYKNGKMQHCPASIEFDPYDEKKLK